MKKTLLLLPAALWCLAACQSPVQPKPVDPTDQTLTLSGAETDGTSKWVFSSEKELSKKRTIALNLALPSTGAQVTYLLTNTSLAAGVAVDLSGVDPSVAPRSAEAEPEAPAGPNRYTRLEVSHDRDVPPLVPRPPRSREGTTPVTVVPDPVVGDAFTFNDTYSNNLKTPTHLRYRSATPVLGRSLYIWVADDTWDGNRDGKTDITDPNLAVPAPTAAVAWTPSGHLVTDAMLEALAARFLGDGTNDVYGWVTGVFGQEWYDAGAQAYTNVVDGKGQIHIFVKNLNPGGTEKGVLMGYFDSGNNFVTTGEYSNPNSNEKILFAIDADSLANPDDDGDSKGTPNDATTWSISDYWPAESVSTLAHEFQHMIQFYQKQLVRSALGATDTWVNEMVSQVTEDLVADKLGLPGPRGVTTYDLGPTDNYQGRFPLFNYVHDSVALTGWDYNDVLPSYSNSYAFGAWLLRNYGGPSLFRAIVQSSGTTATSVVDAVNRVNQSPSFTPTTYPRLVRDWGLATYLASSSLRPGLKYADGDPSDGDATKFSWTMTDGAVTRAYAVGSVDLSRFTYYYRNGSLATRGPRAHTGGFSVSDKVASGATYIYNAGVHQGRYKKQLVLPAGVSLTVVVR